MDLATIVTRRLAALAPGAGRLLVAVSGGADSVAALRLLHGSGHAVAAAHLDHALRDDSPDDARFVEDLCAELGIELLTRRVDVGAVADQRGWNVEDAARRVRYSFLHEAARSVGADAIVVAHTRDDQAETFLLQALRGSAYPSGMPARRGMVIRPLLEVARDALRHYLATLEQAWREDPSNIDVTRARAWLRRDVMPVITGRYPAAATQLAWTAASVGEARSVIDDLARGRFGGDAVRVAALTRSPRAVQRSAIATLLETAGVVPDRELIAAVLDAAADAAHDPQRGPWRRSVGEDSVVRVAYGLVHVVKPARRYLDAAVPVGSVAAWRDAVRGLPETALDPNEPLPDEAHVARWASTHPDLVLRHRTDGDRVRLPGGGKLLSDLLVERKVPREERDALLLLASGRDVVWVAGVPLDTGRTRDERFMALALEQAALAAAAGELPVGAVLVRGDDVLAAAHNRTEATGDPGAHAEVEVLRDAGAATSDWRLTGATLYVTLEPCPMCFGAVLQTRIARVVYGADNPREGALGGVMDLRWGGWKRTPEIEGGVLAAESGRLLTEFFAALRGE